MTGNDPGQPSTPRVSTARYAQGPTHPDIDDVVPVTAATRRTMQANRRRDTRPELQLRSLIHAAGLRYRVDMPLAFDPRRRADLTFTRVGLYVFLDGCFWHGCPEHFVIPKTRTTFWLNKITANRARDLATRRQIEEHGGTVVRVWEHEDPQVAANHVIGVYRRLLLSRV